METKPIRSIVIVDDEKSFTDMIGQLLGDCLDAPVHTFTHPAEALKNLAALEPGIVITDYYMPDMNGLELIRAVETLIPDTPCVLITGHTFNLEDQGPEALKNLKAVLPKPFRWKQLADMIERYWIDDHPPARRI
ncbi:MAG TPA: response regulator [Rariglobus sp.]|nr:response regulator [Rariglobus sp.]